MREKLYAVFLAITGLAGWLTFWLIISNVDPFTASIREFAFFYISLALALSSTLFLLGWQARKRLIRHFRLPVYVRAIWRETLLAVALVILLLILQSGRLLSWWNALLLVTAFAVLEYFFIIYSQEN